MVLDHGICSNQYSQLDGLEMVGHKTLLYNVYIIIHNTPRKLVYNSSLPAFLLPDLSNRLSSSVACLAM